MIKFDLENLFKLEEHGLNLEDFNAQGEKIPLYLEGIFSKEVGFYEILDDDETITKIKEYAASVEGKYEHIVVLGIGGSSLGTICLQKSLGHMFNQSNPTLHVLQNIDPDLISDLEDAIDYSKTLFIAISKSGGTAETLAEYFYFRKKIESMGLHPTEHFAFVTDPNVGWLREMSQKEEIPTFDIPPNVGGRFSVLTPVGLLPAALIGLDIDALIEGAKNQRQRFLSTNFDENLSFQLATIQYQMANQGKNINVMYPYSERLKSMSDWYAQLLAESIGKTENIGITPVSATGVTDQHSQSQLYMDGPFDKLIMFIKVEKFSKDLAIGYEEEGHYLSQKTFNQLMHNALRGTADALTEKQKANMTIQVNEVSATTIGELFMLFEGSVAFLGEFYNINAFDQPGVELSKVLTKQYLNESA